MVKIYEVSQQPDNKVNFDIVDDLHVYMKNDPMFYRKQYYPMMLKFGDNIKAEKKFDINKELTPLVDSAVKSYLKKYNIAKKTSDIFGEEDRKSLIQKIYTDEIDHLRKGDY